MNTLAEDIKGMINAWDLSRYIWIKKFGNDAGFQEWFQERTGLTKEEVIK